jgi:hypothetical protein
MVTTLTRVVCSVDYLMGQMFVHTYSAFSTGKHPSIAPDIDHLITYDDSCQRVLDEHQAGKEGDQ